ncbi:MAG: ROK family protein [Pseudomonadota bacterium]
MRPAYRVAADIGATWARFRLLDAGGRSLGQRRLPTRSFGAGARFVQQVDALCAEIGPSAGRLAGVVLAVAGPVQEGRAQMTNGELLLDQPQLARGFDCPVRICNDFYALAHGLNAFEQLRPLGTAQVDPSAVRVLLGPGSGLGMALCVPVAGTRGFQVLPSEGGHAPLAVRTPLEHEVLRTLQSQSGAVPIWETVLSGPGLLRLYRALAEVRDEPPIHGTPEAVSAAALDGSDELATATIEQFGAWLGDCAASLAFTACAEGGVYLVGDLARAIAEPLATGPLRNRFDARDVMTDYARRIAINLVLDPDPGLLGVSVLAAAQDD